MKLGMGADGRHADIVRDAAFGGELRVFDIEFDQRFGMFRDEGDRCDHDARPSAPARLISSSVAGPIHVMEPTRL